MRFRIDMLHHNPGEAPFDTRFAAPEHLKAYGFNGQVFKHINTVATFETVAPGVFPRNDRERTWLDQFTADREKEIHAAKAAGLEVYYHIDLFVLPQRIVEHFHDEITDPKTGRISLHRPKTLDLHRALFDEILARYPEIDGFIVRVGETYLFDTPYHTGNGAVHYTPERPVAEKQADFVKLLNFLREEICIKHSKKLLHRTWDTWPNRFHASKDFYLAVTEQIDPHPNLVFSIKHTQVDFHRWVRFNPCLTAGKHPQVIEVQCQREYEGKGAFPNYAVKGVIDGFAEPGSEQGIHSIMHHQLIQGIYTWSRGGGWYGPYITRENELWCDLNGFVIAQYAKDPTRSEANIFHQYCADVLHLSTADEAVFRDIALSSLAAVAKGKCCAAWDSVPENRDGAPYPTNQWMRDDVLHGLDKLGPVFDFLIQANLVIDALAEKAESVAIWQAMRSRCDDFSPLVPADLREIVTTSVEYGLRLFSAISAAWEALLAAKTNSPHLAERIARFDTAWTHYEALPDEYPRAASLYRPFGWHWPNEPSVPGLAASIDGLRAARTA